MLAKIVELIFFSLGSQSMYTPYRVTNTTDSGAGSLREAIIDANATTGNDQIIFDSSVFLAGVGTIISLTAALPSIVDISTGGTLTITGPGASSLTIDANGGNYSIFSIDNGGDLTISGVTVTGANSPNDGGAFKNSGSLTVTNSTLSGNTASGTNNGGGIWNEGTLTVSSSAISGNSAYYGGGIFNTGTVTISNSTFSSNSALYGGGMDNRNGGTTTISNSPAAH